MTLPENLKYLLKGASRTHVQLRTHFWRPPTDVFETEETLEIRLEVAGMREDDFTIQLDERNLLISGIRPDTPGRRSFHQMEIRFGEFRTEIELPVAVDTAEAKAIYQNGFLCLSIPKARLRKITVTE